MLVNDSNYGTETTVSGEAQANIVLGGADIKVISITANTPTTTFDANITNLHNVIIWSVENMTGSVLEHTSIPTSQNVTLTITNASADEDFNYNIIAIERYA